MYKAIIVDDEPKHINHLQNLLVTHHADNISIVATCENTEDALQEIVQHRPDLLFLDIELRGSELNGLDLVPRLKGHELYVIFVSSFDHYAAAAFQLGDVQYLLKTVKNDKLTKVMNQYYNKTQLLQSAAKWEKYEENLSHILARLPSGPLRRNVFLPDLKGDIRAYLMADIVYLEATGSRTLVALKGNLKLILVNESLLSLEERLPSELFFRIHRQHIVNREHVLIYNAPFIRMKKVHTDDVHKNLNVAQQRKAAFIDWLKGI